MKRQPKGKNESDDELGPRIVQRRVLEDTTVAELPERVANESGATSTTGHISFIRFAEADDNPAERLQQHSAQKEAERLSARKDKEHAQVAAMIQEGLTKSMSKEEQIVKAYKQLEEVKVYIEKLKDLEGKLREELKERLIYKTQTRERLHNANAGARQELARKLDEETNNHMVENKRDVEVKGLLNDIIRIKQSQEEVDKKIEKLKQEKQTQKEKTQNDEHTKLRVREKVDVKERLDQIVGKIKDKNSTFAREYLNARVLSEQVARARETNEIGCGGCVQNARVKGRGKILVVLIPSEPVTNPFLYQQYLKIGRHHKTITVTPNEKILEPEKHALAELDERVGHMEIYAQGVDAAHILSEVIEKGLVRQSAPPPISRPPIRRADEFQDIVSLGGSEDEDEDAPEIIPSGNEAGLDSRIVAESIGGLNQSSVPEPKQLSEQAKSLASLLTPDPVRVFNDALILKKSGKKAAQSGPGPTIKVDLVITNDYVSTFFDNCVAVKLYFELEIFFKRLFYRNFEKVLKNLSFYSEDYKIALHTERQRTDVNLHYHSEGALPDVNARLSERTDQKLITQDVSTLTEEQVAKAQFFNLALAAKKPDHLEEKQSNLVIFLGVISKGLIYSLLKLVYEDTGHFDNLAVSVIRTSFSVEVHNGTGSLQENFDNFAEFISYFEQQVERRLYTDMVVLSVHYELASKIDLMYSAKKSLNMVALPFMQERQTYGAELKSIIKPHLTPLPSAEELPQLQILRRLVEDANLSSLVAELPHTILLSKSAPQQYEKFRKLADLLQEVSREDSSATGSK